MDRVRCFIETHLMDEIDPERLAGLCGLSAAQFPRFFKEMTGLPLQRFIRMRRMHYAARQMRQGAGADEAFRANAYKSRAGFERAFFDVIGAEAGDYAATRGRCRMPKPEFRLSPLPFHVVGYPFEAIPDLSWTESGAYWQGQYFPPFDAEEYKRICGGPEEIGVWKRRGEGAEYVFGYVVPEIGYVPEGMRAVTIPGGGFMVFRAPAYRNTEELGENMRTTWYFAYAQWLPTSDFEIDHERVPFEYYHENDSLIFIPVTQKAGNAKKGSPNERSK